MALCQSIIDLNGLMRLKLYGGKYDISECGTNFHVFVMEIALNILCVTTCRGVIIHTSLLDLVVRLTADVCDLLFIEWYDSRGKKIGLAVEKSCRFLILQI
jgi:hypothetical protein